MSNVNGISGSGPVISRPFESAKVDVKVTGRVQYVPEEMGFGTQPPGGYYVILNKPLVVNGKSYDKLFIGAETFLPEGRELEITGKAFERAMPVVEGMQQYAVIESPTVNEPRQHRPGIVYG